MAKGISGLDQIDLRGALIMLIFLVAGYGVLKVIEFIMLLVAGSTADVAVSGNVAVPSVINDTINTSVNSVQSGFALLNAGETIILGLIGLVVILKIFWPLIRNFIGGRKGKTVN